MRCECVASTTNLTAVRSFTGLAANRFEGVDVYRELPSMKGSTKESI